MATGENKTGLKYSMLFAPPLKRTVLSGIPDIGFSGGQGVRVAVIDSGVNTSVKVNDNVDFTGFGTSDGIAEQHGTIVAGIIRHFARSSEILNIKVTQTRDNVNWWHIFNGFKYARDNGAHIVNLSIGHYHGPGKQCNGKCRRCMEVQSYAKNNNMIIVAAAGNEGPLDGSLNCPGVAPDVIAVGMTNRNGTGVEDISSRAIPGVVKPNLLTSGYVSFDSPMIRGTSFATPVITGILAASLPSFNFDSNKLLFALYNACEELPNVPKHHQGHGVLNLKNFVEGIKHETTSGNRQG